MLWLKKLPTTVIVGLFGMASLVVVAVIGGYVLLTISGSPTEDYTKFVQTGTQLLTVIFSGIGATAGVAAARSSDKTQRWTDGDPGGMTDTVTRIVAANEEAHPRNPLIETIEEDGK